MPIIRYTNHAAELLAEPRIESTHIASTALREVDPELDRPLKLHEHPVPWTFEADRVYRVPADVPLGTRPRKLRRARTLRYTGVDHHR